VEWDREEGTPCQSFVLFGCNKEEEDLDGDKNIGVVISFYTLGVMLRTIIEVGTKVLLRRP